MSIGVELALARCVAAIDAPVVHVSDRGAGSPLLSALGHVERMALRPLGGMYLFPVGHFTPPVHLIRAHGDAVRLVQGAVVCVDCAVADLGMVLRGLASVTADGPDMIRLRVADAPSPDGMTCLLGRGDDSLWCREGPLVARMADAAGPLARGEIDEFDELATLVARGGDAGVIDHLTFAPDRVELSLRPALVLDAPDTRQIDAALSGGRAVFDATGSCGLVIPHLSGTPAPFGLAVSGLPSGAPDPAILSVPAAWKVMTRRNGGTWQATIMPDRVTEASAPELVLPPGHDHARAEVSRVWISGQRRRGAWEAWDEARAQIDLEVSW